MLWRIKAGMVIPRGKRRGKELPGDRNLREMLEVTAFAAGLHCRCKSAGRCKVCLARKFLTRLNVAEPAGMRRAS
jgi:hypothetical protein